MNRILKSVVVAALLLGATPVFAQGWVTPSGQPVPASPSQQMEQGFGGLLLVTPDQDWKEKWDTPPEVTPHFNQADVVDVGQPLSVLVFFTNPALDKTETAHLSCTFSLVRPDGSYELKPTIQRCYDNPISRSASSLRLSETVLHLKPTADDMKGTWRVKVRLTDDVRGVTLNLEEAFRVR